MRGQAEQCCGGNLSMGYHVDVNQFSLSNIKHLSSQNEYYKDTNVQSSAIFSESGGKKSFDYLEGRFLQVLHPHFCLFFYD